MSDDMPKIDSGKARRILMNASAITEHLFRIEGLAREAGIDLSHTNPLSDVVSEFHTSCMDFFTQMEILALASGIEPESDRTRKMMDQFVDRRCGVRHGHVRDEDE